MLAKSANYEPLKPLSSKNDFKKYEQNELKPKIIAIVGKKRSGKTALGLRLLENLVAKGKKGYAIKFPLELPGVENIGSIEEAESESVVLLDEADLIYPAISAKSKSSLSLYSILKLAGQKDLTFIAIVQNTALLNVNILRLLDEIYIKEPSLFQIETERSVFKYHLKLASDMISCIPEEKRNSVALLYSDYFRGLVEFKPPSFWSDDISKAYKNFKMV